MISSSTKSILNPIKSKFSYITYPFFGTYVIPDVQIEFDRISAAVAKRYTTVKLGNSSNFLEELFDIEALETETRFKFHVTAKSTQELIMLPKRCVWGVDITGRLHNLHRLEEYPQICIKPYKITKSKYIWFKEITKPIETKLSLQNIEEDLLYYWYSFLYIDYVWELYRVTPEYHGKTSEWT
jgi:hypothetical protein